MVLGLAVEDQLKLKEKLVVPWRFFFGDSVRAFGTVCLLLLVSLAIAPAKDYLSEWHGYQRKYERVIRDHHDSATLRRHFQSGVQQIWVPEAGVVDRCTTCHAGVLEPALGDVKAQPFHKHPFVPHPVTQFGCVLCHEGQGVATTVAEAHESTEAWEQPILPARYLQAGCGQCHHDASSGIPVLNNGRKLLAAYGCVRCHNVTQPDGHVMQPTDDPPALTHIAEKTSREWIFAWIKNPQAYSTTATMPNFQLSDEDARDVSAFVMAQSKPLAPAQIPPATAASAKADDSTAGASLYGQSFCASCHAIQNTAGMMVGGDFGPELTRIGSKARPEWLLAWLSDPAHYDLDTKMPHYRFNGKQLDLLVGFLSAKTDSDLLSAVHLDPATPEQIAHGHKLVAELGCASCHEINGIKHPDNFAPDLSRVGSRSRAQIVFTPGLDHNIAAYISAKISNPRSFGAALKMPQFTLTPDQNDALTTALLAQTDRAFSLPASMRVEAAATPHYEPAGKAGRLISDMRCFSCHTINGRGGTMAPDLSLEGSGVQGKWLEEFLANPNTLRPSLIRRMPKFNMTNEEIKTLSSYMLTVYQTPAFDAQEFALPHDPALVQRGRELFATKYACQSCHIADYAKDKGYIGPALASVGTRLTPAWIYHWIKDPQALRPGTLEPNQNISDSDAMALTAYLSSLQASSKTAKGKP